MARSGNHRSPARRTEAKIRRMRRRGFSEREIGRRTGLGKSFVHDVVHRKRRLSTQRAAAVSERLSRIVGKMRVIRAGGVLDVVEPLHQRDFSKIGRFWNTLEKARRLGDRNLLERELTKAQRTIKTTEGTIMLETDPDMFRELDDAGLLTPQEILIGESA
jgi:hypothetical protein